MITETQITVRYAETDQMGVVHHAVYPIWFEAARTDFLKQAGRSYAKIEEDGFILPLTELQCRYKTPARYGEDVIVITKIEKYTYVKLIFSYEVRRAGDRALLTEGSTTHAWVNRSLRPVNLAKSAPELYGAIAALA